MMWGMPIEVAVHSLLYPGAFSSVPADTAIQWLRHYSGEDFGEDVAAWIRWAKEMEHLPSDYPDQGDADLL